MSPSACCTLSNNIITALFYMHVGIDSNLYPNDGITKHIYYNCPFSSPVFLITYFFDFVFFFGLLSAWAVSAAAALLPF
jgi:hypothetical protein